MPTKPIEMLRMGFHFDERRMGAETQLPEQAPSGCCFPPQLPWRSAGSPAKYLKDSAEVHHPPKRGESSTIRQAPSSRQWIPETLEALTLF